MRKIEITVSKSHYETQASLPVSLFLIDLLETDSPTGVLHGYSLAPLGVLAHSCKQSGPELRVRLSVQQTYEPVQVHLNIRYICNRGCNCIQKARSQFKSVPRRVS